MTRSISVDDLTMAHPVYTLNLTGAQRRVLEWLTVNGALYTHLAFDPETVAKDCASSVSTVYEALNRLTALRLIEHRGPEYRVNPRFFFSQNPEVAQLVLDALQAPDVVPDDRAQQPRRTSSADARRRRQVRSVS